MSDLIAIDWPDGTTSLTPRACHERFLALYTVLRGGVARDATADEVAAHEAECERLRRYDETPRVRVRQ